MERKHYLQTTSFLGIKQHFPKSHTWICEFRKVPLRHLEIICIAFVYVQLDRNIYSWLISCKMLLLLLLLSVDYYFNGSKPYPLYYSQRSILSKALEGNPTYYILNDPTLPCSELFRPGLDVGGKQFISGPADLQIV